MSILKKNRIIISSLALLVIVGAIIVYSLSQHNIKALTNVDIYQDQNQNIFSGIHADYGYFDNYEMADERANLVIIGYVIKVNEPERIVIGESINSFTGEKVQHSDVYTVSEVKVDKVIKGNVKPCDVIKIKQFEGVIFKKGERHIFFLETYEDAKLIKFKVPASPINPLQGNVKIENGKTKKENSLQFVNDGVKENVLVRELKNKIQEIEKKKQGSRTIVTDSRL